VLNIGPGQSSSQKIRENIERKTSCLEVPQKFRLQKEPPSEQKVPNIRPPESSEPPEHNKGAYQVLVLARSGGGAVGGPGHNHKLWPGLLLGPYTLAEKGYGGNA